MTTADQIRETKQMLDDVLSRWAPFPNDPFQQKMIRALLNLHAFEKDIAAKRRGETPIRTDYPISLS